MRLKTAFLIVAFCLAGNLRTAQACVCSGAAVSDRDEAAAEFQAAAVVFEGEVLPGGHEITTYLSVIPFRVTKSYKGASEEVLEIYDASAGTDCGFGEQKPGMKFFVYGFRDGDGKVHFHACSRTTYLDGAGADIRFARNEPATKQDLAPPGERWRLYRDPTLAQRGASLKGTVRREDGGDLGNVFVTVWDVDKNGQRSSIGLVEATQKINPDGSFEIRFLPPGTYIVTAGASSIRATDGTEKRRVASEDSRISPSGKCEGEYGRLMLAERQVASIRVTCRAVSDSVAR
jgi:hypothetical protein